MIKKTFNGGLNWSDCSISTTNSIVALFRIGNIVWAGGTNGVMYKSYNSGANWSTQYISTNKTISNILFRDTLTGWCCGSYGTLFKTVNGGNTWIDQNFPSYYYFLSIANPGYDTLFVCGYNRAVLKSITGGNVISVRNLSLVVPDKFSLSQNYPNPFNPTTKIKFDIPQKTVIARSGATWQSLMVTLKVYNILGKEIATLANETLQPGTYEVTFDGTNLPSGIYFYRLTTDEHIVTKKLVLLK
jgi:hypothetical protein